MVAICLRAVLKWRRYLKTLIKTRVSLLYMIKAMVGDAMAPQGGKPSTAMVFTYTWH